MAGAHNNYYHQNGHGISNGAGLGCTTNGDLNLTIKTDMETLVRAMAAPDSGLEVKDRNWLKITIPNAFIGSDVVDWLFNHVEGFPDRRDARKYACDMLRYGFIRHAVNKVRFSEQCYYIFGDFNQSTLNSQLMSMNGGAGVGAGNLFTLNEESEVDFDSVSELDRDTLYAPMNYQGNYQMIHNFQHQYQQQPKLYSNLNGLSGPPPPPSYISSSSSNSTASNNTTTHTIATITTANGIALFNNTNGSSSGVGGSNTLSSSGASLTTINTTCQSNFSAAIQQNGGIVSSETNNACQFYYPTPIQQNNSIHSAGSSSSSLNKMNGDTINIDDTISNQTHHTQCNETNINR
jgi:hypothetical protein